MHEEFYKSLPKGRCNPCKYAKAVVAGDDFTFYDINEDGTITKGAM